MFEKLHQEEFSQTDEKISISYYLTFINFSSFSC
jgi:hypothetical protein